MAERQLQADRLVAQNVAIHDRVARKYDALHGEIFNDVEQLRLQHALAHAREAVRSGSVPLQALDFGCGSGNLTRYLLELGLQVTAADVSAGFLDLVRTRYPGTRLATLLLEGGRTSHIADHSFDLIASYSVLHHIPDYLQACRELGRMCRPGGVVYIDHEHTEEFWQGDPVYAAFRAEALRFDWRKYMRPSNYVHRIRRIFNARHSNEGDIHVWPDDHIEWSRIKTIMGELGFEVVIERDYLLNRSLYRPEVYARYQGRCTDTKMLVLRKRLD